MRGADVANKSIAVASIPRDMAERVANARCPVLITGETGVGKGYLARWLHDHGPRAGGPFVAVNCGAIPDGLIDSHLFGHARGAFSDAGRDHPGLVRSAEGGTLLLDEVAELPPAAQRRLLRLLEEREVQPVGETQAVRVDIRIIAATSRDLAERVRAGAFREDLLYRLDVLGLEIRPLRERPADVVPLLEEFNAVFAARLDRRPVRLEAAAKRLLAHHAWPGNVRELRTVVERLHVLCPHTRVSVDDLRVHGRLETPALAARPARTGARPLLEARLRAVRTALEACGGNVSRAAARLGVHRSTLHRWMGTHHLPAFACQPE